MNAVEQLYGADDLFSPRAVKEYLDRVRRAERSAATELGDAAELLEAVLASSPGVGILLGWDSRRRARMICAPLNEAANAHNAAATLSVLAWKRFHATFGDTIDAAKGRGSRSRTMDWTEA